jgi:hypothetical protein
MLQSWSWSWKAASRLWPIVAVLVLMAPPAWPQSRMMGADLEGTVRDDTGAVLPGTTVTATNVETELVRGTTSDSAGRFLLPALPPGVYRVTAELFGFGARTRDNVALLLGQAARVDFALALSGQSETITVIETAPVLDARRTAVATVISTRQIDNLPISGRNFIAFSVLTPGVTTDRGAPAISATSGLSFTGQSARSNNIMVDGFDNNDSTIGGVRSLFSQEAVREFQVLTDSYSAEFGNASGGVVNIMTRTGTNDLHGNVFAFVRDDRLNARHYFESHDAFGNEQKGAKAPFDQIQWGATLAGPLRKGKTFFFLSFERGDTDATNAVTIAPEVVSVLQAGGFPVEAGNVPYQAHYTQALAKLDHQWSPRSTLVLRASTSDSRDENADRFGGTVARSRASALDRKDWFVSAAQTNVLSDRWLNEARVQGARFQQVTESLDPTCTGRCDGLDEGGPSVTLPGLASVGRASGTPAPRVNNRIQVGDTLSYFSGGHLLKVGVDFDLTDTRRSSLPSFFGGSYVFSALPGSALTAIGLPARSQPVSALEAFSLGLPAAYIQGYGQPTISYTHKELAVFVQDEWRASSRLTVRAGLRYQRQFWASRHFRVSDVGGSTFEYDFPQDRNNLGPRVGVSWDARGDGRTWLHGGYGMFFADQITAAAGVPDIIDGDEHVRIFTRTFPATVAAWRAPGRRGAEPATGASSVVSIDPSLQTPYAHQVAVGADQAIGADLVLAANLIYVRGHHQLGTIDYNPLLPALGPGRRPNDVGGRAGTSASLLQYTSYGQSWYKGLALSLTKRFSHGYEFMASYTLSKADDTVNDYGSSPQNPGRGRNPADPFGLPLGFDPTRERGPSYNDQRHRLVVSGIAQMPGRLQVSGVFTAASGRPFSPLAGDGTFDRARTDPADPASGVGRNSALTEGEVVLDLRLSRSFKLAGRSTLEAICDVFNVLNTVNVADVNNVFGRGAYPSQPATDAAGRVTYGLYQRVLPPRQVQFALRLGF